MGHDHALALEQDPEPPIAEAAPLAGERAQRARTASSPRRSGRRTVFGSTSSSLQT
jgi:hypothetical protein